MGKASRWLDQVLGEPGNPEKPSLIQRVKTIQAQTEEMQAQLAALPAQHQQWHADMAAHAVNGRPEYHA